jgi:hypothetical protein
MTDDNPYRFRWKPLIIAAIISFLIFVLTGIGFSVGPDVLGEGVADFCSFFHIIPFGMAFSGGGGIFILFYYIVAWVLLTAFIYLFIPK